jgi:hypothetical protein
MITSNINNNIIVVGMIIKYWDFTLNILWENTDRINIQKIIIKKKLGTVEDSLLNKLTMAVFILGIII